MPRRLVPLVNGEFYHVFNRGVADQPTFLDTWDYKQALLGLKYYSFMNPPVRLSLFKELSSDFKASLLQELFKKDEKLIDIISFVLMPNHFHFLLRQVVDRGIPMFLSRFTNSYTKFFNKKNDRLGHLFQGSFKAVHIVNNEQLLHVSRYIHLNPLVSYVVDDKNFMNYEWSSLPYYLNASSSFVEPKPVLSNFKNGSDYLKFVLDQADYGKKLEQIKHLTVE